MDTLTVREAHIQDADMSFNNSSVIERQESLMIDSQAVIVSMIIFCLSVRLPLKPPSTPHVSGSDDNHKSLGGISVLFLQWQTQLCLLQQVISH